MNRKGLGMWLLSKVVILIFLTSLILVLSNFLVIYQQKVISDTAQGRTRLLAEVADSAASYPSSSDSIALNPSIKIKDTERDYTIGVKEVENDRLVFSLVFKNFKNITKIKQRGGFSAASAIILPKEVENIKVFNWTWQEYSQVPEDQTGSQTLLVNPAVPVGEEKENAILFIRNKTVFCVGAKPAESETKTMMNELGGACTRGQ